MVRLSSSPQALLTSVGYSCKILRDATPKSLVILDGKFELPSPRGAYSLMTIFRVGQRHLNIRMHFRCSRFCIPDTRVQDGMAIAGVRTSTFFIVAQVKPRRRLFFINSPRIRCLFPCLLLTMAP